MRKIRFGLIGCGRIAPKHAEALVALEWAELAAVCDVELERVQEFGSKYNADYYTDYTELLKREDIEAVCICTPSGLHAEMGIDAAQAGKHVLVEKPMALSLKDADLLIQACQESGVTLGVVHQNRFNKAVVNLRTALNDGRFGKLTHGNATIRWNRDQEYYSQAPWRGTWAMDGGCLMNQSIHNIDLLQWMLGPVQSVFAYTATQLRNIEAEDNAVAVLKFKNGALGVIEASTTIFPKNLEETLNIFGEKGSVIVGGLAVNKIETWNFADDPEETQKVLTEQGQDPPNVYGFGHKALINDFIAAINEKIPPDISGIEGRKALEIILAIYKSVRTGQEVYLPLVEEA